MEAEGWGQLEGKGEKRWRREKGSVGDGREALEKRGGKCWRGGKQSIREEGKGALKT